ncbi:MAG: hypothetical protein H6679_03835 [Epsilonproteobacteria bacterium]|nr:hypothetical protein [Campylobacterota bacterium]
MKKMIVFLGSIFLTYSFAQAANLDGRATPTYIETSMNSFSSGDSARGWVYFKSGFKVPSGGTLNVNLSVPVNGDINLNDGRLILDGDLFLSSSARLTGSGLIEGNGFAIHFSNSLVFTSTISLELPDKDNKIIIDGHNKILTLSAAGSLNCGGDASSFKTTVTFRNLRIRGVHTHDPTSASILTNTGSFRNGILTDFVFENSILDVVNTLSLRATTTICGKCLFQTRRSRGPFRIIKSGSTLSIDFLSELEIGSNDQCIYAHEEELFFSRSIRSSLRLKGCRLTTKTRSAIKFGGASALIFFTPLRVLIDGVVTADIPGGDLVLGRGSPTDNVDLNFMPSSKLVLTTGTRLVYNNPL